MKLKLFSLFILIALFFVSAKQAAAYQFNSGTALTYPAGQTVNGSLYAFGQNVEIDSNINGDLFCGGQSILINGNVSGDLICAGQTVQINGYVNGTIRVAGQDVTLNNKVYSSVSLLAQTAHLGIGSSIGTDLGLIAQNLSLQGSVGRDVFGVVGKDATINAKIGRDLTLGNVSYLTLGPKASIAGNLRYTSSQTLQRSPGSVVKGSVQRYEPQPEQTPQPQNDGLFSLILGILSFFFVGLILVFLFPTKTQNAMHAMFDYPLASLGWGVVLLLAIPILCIILFITILGIPLGILIFLTWLAAIFISRVLVAILIGNLILTRTSMSNKYTLFYDLIIGVLICWVLFAIPFIGGILSLLAIIWGFGGILLAFAPHKGPETLS